MLAGTYKDEKTCNAIYILKIVCIVKKKLLKMHIVLVAKLPEH